MCHRPCSYVPPRVLERLSRRGIDAARLSTQQATRSRMRRAATIARLGDLLDGGSTAIAQRIVYDSQRTWQLRVREVRNERQGKTGDEAVDRVHEYAGIVRDYLQGVLGRNSLDDRAMDLILNVHFGVDYMNAFWDGDEMTFGDGDGQIFVSFTRSLDVVAHELAHGVTQFTAGLEYRDQPGALNEHFSDVFGAAITQHHEQQDAASADWLIGDEIMGPRLQGEALRSMKAPGTAYDNDLMGSDPQPAHMRDYYQGPEDDGGVHINSGIPNRAFYLVALEIDTPPATRIWYAALQKLWPRTRFEDAAAVIAECARLLAADGAVPAGAVPAVRQAFREVGLGT